jgi:glycerol-3-phosphate dehydrogenase
MVGTTDEKTAITHHVEPPKQDIDFIISEMKTVFGPDYDYEGNLVSAWAGIRPLVTVGKEGEFVIDHNKVPEERTYRTSIKEFMLNRLRWLSFKLYGNPRDSTASISRNHVIEKTDSGLVSLMGGKWTSFRKMGEETVNTILYDFKDQMNPKYTES